MPLGSAVVSRVLGHDFPPPLNPADENTTCTLLTDTDIDSTESRDVVHKIKAVIIAIKLMHTHKKEQAE